MSSTLERMQAQIEKLERRLAYLEALDRGLSALKVFTVQTDSANIAVTDEVIIANKGTAMTLTLPAATGTGRLFNIANIGAGVCTVEGDGAETIDGAANKALDQWEAIQVVDRAAGAWTIIASHGTIA